MEAKAFGEYLRQLRKAKKLTIRQLDLYSNVSNSYISQMERGERGIPSPDILNKLSKPLGVEYEELMRIAGYIKEDKPKDSVDKMIDYLELNLTDEEIMERMTIRIDDMILSEDETRQFIAFVRAQRAMKKQFASSKNDNL